MLDSKTVIVIPVKRDEVRLARGQAKYLSETGFCNGVDALYAFESSCNSHDIWRVHRHAKHAFKSVQHVQPAFAIPHGFSTDNWLIQSAIMRMLTSGSTEITVLPPDALPLKENWIKLVGIGKRVKIGRTFPVTRTATAWLKILNVTDPPWFQNIGSKGFYELPDQVSWRSVSPEYGACWGRDSGMHLISLSEQIPAQPPRKTITIRRWAAIGDVIAATSVARKLDALGYNVNMVSFSACGEALLYCPSVQQVEDNTQREVQVNLDEVYEKHPEWHSKHIRDIFFDSAGEQLQKHGITLGKPDNCAPVLGVSEVERALAFEQMSKHTKPWVLVAPMSHMSARSVPKSVMAGLFGKVSGTLFWYSNEPAPAGFADLNIRTIRQAMSFISQSDLVVSVDSAPLHMAAGLKRPVIAIRQSFDPILRISDQRDVTTFQKEGLDCISCNAYVCRIDTQNPPCANFNPADLARVINAKLSGIFGHTVSAVIPVYGPKPDRINKCLDAVIDQVDEVILAVDGTNRDLIRVKQGPKIRIVMHKNPERLGYGRTCNLGAREATGRHLLMLNDDCYLKPGAVMRMKAQMSDPRVGVVGCLLTYPNGRIQHGGTHRSGSSFGHVDHMESKPSITVPTDMEYVTFAAALVRRKAFFDVEGFDDRFDSYATDSDICLRMRRAGHRVVYEPNASGIHEESQSSSQIKNQLLARDNAVLTDIWKDYFRSNNLEAA